MPSKAAFHAVNRFGLGARRGELQAADADPRGWLLAQLHDYADIPAMELSGRGRELVSSLHGLTAAERQQVNRRMIQLYREESGQRLLRLRDSSVPFAERLVLFWSNHFSVAVGKQGLNALINTYEAEAIRPHILGRFEDMLIAVLRHPAMLIYLDNQKSFGKNALNMFMPDSQRGVNENLARETLELYTLGVQGGYRQADVEALAKILTGWTLRLHRFTRKPIPRYRFEKSLHEPGPKELLGQNFPQAGEAQGIAALRMLARQPATARFLARKLAVHFVADRPPAAVVEALARVFLDSEGDLAEVARALVQLDAAWEQPLSKLKTPQDLVISAARLVGSGKGRQLFNTLHQLGQTVFRAPSPEGYPDVAAEWNAPDAILKRVSLAHQLGNRFGARLDPERLMAASIGPVSSADTRFAIRNAPSRQEALALLLASPEFQRR